MTTTTYDKNKIYTIVYYNKQENCIENIISCDDLNLARTKAIFWVWRLIEFNNPWISFDELQKKWDIDDWIDCVAWDFTYENWLYVFDWEDVCRIEIKSNFLYTNLQ